MVALQNLGLGMRFLLVAHTKFSDQPCTFPLPPRSAGRQAQALCRLSCFGVEILSLHGSFVLLPLGTWRAVLQARVWLLCTAPSLVTRDLCVPQGRLSSVADVFVC